jgi:ribosomal protein S18 acetylase RimI-like enzyme
MTLSMNRRIVKTALAQAYQVNIRHSRSDYKTGDAQMKIQIQPLGDADLSELARLNYEVRHDSPLSNKAPSVAHVEKAFGDLVTRETSNITVQARDDSSGALVGWLNLYAGIPTMVFLGRWHPLVPRGRKQSSIARRLIQEAKSQTAILNRSRLEIQFDEITPEHRPLLRTFDRWYSAEGFLKASEEYHMRAKLKKSSLEGFQVPQGFSLHSLTTVGNEDIRDCFLKAFLDSKDRLFLSMKPEQQDVTFHECFRRSEPVDQEHSYCIREDGRVVAFVLLQKQKDEYLVGYLGVHPKYRGKGLGGTILAHSLRDLISLGVRSADIETDVTNTPAIRLYKRLGFTPVNREAYYYWNV